MSQIQWVIEVLSITAVLSMTLSGSEACWIYDRDEGRRMSLFDLVIQLLSSIYF